MGTDYEKYFEENENHFHSQKQSKMSAKELMWYGTWSVVGVVIMVIRKVLGKY